MGQGAGIMNLLQITKNHIGTPYNLGETDCFSWIVRYLTEQGVELPKRYRGWTMETYKTLFTANPARANELMIDFLDEHLKAINPAHAFSGDILLLELKKTTALSFLAIHGGNLTAIAASKEHGIGAIPLQYYKKLRAWKCKR